ncbi:hypothetical protein EC973_006262 [Apophysomyces ossiformis]|uniref:MINDY deubiquitinase domain-containing protein n=1 Tax=Apophysomyces ossiformis TaxID=679940 RepID=A0A8H7BVN0_9FUNG|nr:hypothetical protein EC973_006262 [Apophysomyces ossiformis]
MSKPGPEDCSSPIDTLSNEPDKSVPENVQESMSDMMKNVHDLQISDCPRSADGQSSEQAGIDDRPHMQKQEEVRQETVRQRSPVFQPAQEYLVKTIDWFDYASNKKRTTKIITQNGNVLLLRGDLEIRPPDREMVTFEYLVDRLGDYLLAHAPSEHKSSNNTESSEATENSGRPTYKLSARQSTAEYVLTYRHNLDAALSIIPNLQTGLDVNVRFSSIHGFEPTAELAMFDLFDVDLDNETYEVVVKQCGSYNAVVECIVQGDAIGDGAVVESLGRQEQQPHGEVNREWAQDDEQKLHQGQQM